MTKLRDRIVEWWDWKVYWLAYGAMQRMVKRNGGFAYLFKLSIDAWLEAHPLSPELKSSTETFYRSLNHRP